MIKDEEELRSLVLQLRREYRSGARYFSTRQLPEYAIMDGLDLTDRQRSLFLTLSVVPLHAHPSGDPKPNLGRGGLWKVCANIWKQHSWAYDPQELVEVEGETELEEFFDRLEIMNSYDAHWWYTCAETLLDELDGDPRTLLRDQSYVAPYIARRVRRYDLPGIADDVSTPFWLRLMHDRTHELDGMRWLSMPVDHTVFEVTKQLGTLDIDIEDRDDRQLVSTFWSVFSQKHRLVPADIERPLRLVGLYWDDGGRDYITKLLKNIRDQA